MYSILRCGPKKRVASTRSREIERLSRSWKNDLTRIGLHFRDGFNLHRNKIPTRIKSLRKYCRATIGLYCRCLQSINRLPRDDSKQVRFINSIRRPHDLSSYELRCSWLAHPVLDPSRAAQRGVDSYSHGTTVARGGFNASQKYYP